MTFLQGLKENRTGWLLIAAATADASLKAVALVDLKRRPADQVRGSKWVWLLVILINSAGLTSLTYLRFGRRRA